MLKYNDNNISVGEIKQLLKNFNLPKARVYKDNEPLIPNLYYIKGNSVYYCTENKELKYLDTYAFNQPYFGVTTNFRVHSNVYDSYTHKYLGRYLRFLKDYAKLDLMSMYNCFSNEQLYNVNVNVVIKNKNGEGNEVCAFNYKDSSYNIYCVPVRFSQKYTIAINCELPINVVACLYKEGRLVEPNEAVNNRLYGGTFETIRRCTFSAPYVYEKLNSYLTSDTIRETQKEAQKEEYLCLLIKVPVQCKSSIVVLEGDYTKCTRFDYNNGLKLLGGLFSYKPTIYDNLDGSDSKLGGIKWFGQYDYNSKLELLSYQNSSGNGLVATRLLEYFSENAITPMSEMYDIEKLQRVLMKRGYVSSDYLGTWSEDDRKGLYRFINDFSINSDEYDVISYLDKDVEYKLGGIE